MDKKVYKVTFAELSDEVGDMLNIDAKRVVAETATEAIVSAKLLLNEDDRDKLYIQEVELVTILD